MKVFINCEPKSFASSSINLNLTNAYLQLFRVYDEVLEKLTILNDNLPEKHYVVDQELTLYAFGDILKKPPKYETADHTTNEKDITVVICNYARPGNIVEIIKEISPMYGLTVRGTQTLVSFAPLAFKLFCAARQNAVLRRSSFPPV